MLSSLSDFIAGEPGANTVCIELVVKYGPVYPRKAPLLRLVPSSEGHSLALALRAELELKLHQLVCSRTRLSPVARHSAVQYKLRIVTLGFGNGVTGRVLERWTNPKHSRRMCSSRYGATIVEREIGAFASLYLACGPQRVG